MAVSSKPAAAADDDDDYISKKLADVLLKFGGDLDDWPILKCLRLRLASFSRELKREALQLLVEAFPAEKEEDAFGNREIFAKVRRVLLFIPSERS